MSRVTRARTALMVATDVGFLVYGTLTLLHVLPSAWLFKDHDNPILLSWNGSFLPLDLLISISGLLAVALRRRGARLLPQPHLAGPHPLLEVDGGFVLGPARRLRLYPLPFPQRLIWPIEARTRVGIA